MKPTSRLLLPLACLAAALALLAGCGGGDDGGVSGPSADSSTDPKTVLDTALGSEGTPIESGVLTLALDVQGSASGALNATVSGPFQSNGEESLPSVDLDVKADVQAGAPISLEGNLTITPDGVFIGYGGENYELDQATFDMLQQSYQQSSQAQQDQGAGGSLSQFGIDPANWLANLKNEGTEDVDGTETVHISGDADIPRLTQDLERVAAATGSVDSGGLSDLRNSIKAASIDVFADSSNSALRKLDVTLDVAEPSSGSTDKLTFSIGIADPNQDQDIEAPSDAKPLEDLLGQVPGLAESLGGVGGTTAPQGSAGGVPPVSSKSTEKYYDCVAQAKSPQAITDCQKLLG
jgi:hypothetical protein